MQKNNIYLKKISLEDKNNIEGLDLLKNITENENELYSSPVPKEINEYLYIGFLKLSEDEEKENKIFRYWILNSNKIIGYSDIKIKDNTGDIGIILSLDERGKNIGLNAMRLLLKEAKENLKLDNITVTTNINNIPMQVICEKLGGNPISSDENIRYNLN